MTGGAVLGGLAGSPRTPNPQLIGTIQTIDSTDFASCTVLLDGADTAITAVVGLSLRGFLLATVGARVLGVRVGSTFYVTDIVGGTIPDAGLGMYLPIGAIIAGGWTSAPSGFLACSGGTFDSGTYPKLAAAIGDTYGAHSGTTYHLPPFNNENRFPRGTTTPGGTGGADTVTMPDHQHYSGTYTVSLTVVSNTTATGSQDRVKGPNPAAVSGQSGNVVGTNPPISNIPKYVDLFYVIRAL